MARKSPDDVRGGVARVLGNVFLLLIVVGGLAAWTYLGGFYRIRQGGGEAAVILRMGAYQRTVSEPGWYFHLPYPIETREIVRMDELESEEFGAVKDGAPGEQVAGDIVVQTQDNNIVHVSFAVQYRRKDAFDVRYRLAEPRATLRAAAEAAVREVVGRTEIDNVLRAGRGPVQDEAGRLLEEILDRYQAGLHVDDLLLQNAQVPSEVLQAFNDVTGAQQDEERRVREAEGYRNEVLPRAEAEAVELQLSAEAYRDAKVAEAAGEAARFEAILAEYQKAPEVTRRRLYLETMEEILPRVKKVIIEPGTAAVLPYAPLGDSRAIAPESRQ